MGDEPGSLLAPFVGSISFSALLICAVIIAGFGVLNNATFTQASAVWELGAADPLMQAAAPLRPWRK